MKKQISILTITSQLSMAFLSTGAFAAPPVPSAEYTMLQRVYALQGVQLSDRELNTEASKIVSDYARTAPADGRQERLESALVQLAVYTPEQASAFVAEAQPAGEALGAATSETDTRRILSSELTRIARSHPAAAQFSSGAACAGAAAVEVAGFFGGIFTILEGKWTYDENPTCSSVDDGPVNYSVNLGALSWPSTGTGTGELYTTTCANPSDHPHAGEGIGIIFGGVGVLIGTVFFMVKYGSNC